MDLLRELVKQRLSAAADEVFELFQKSFEEYEVLVLSQNRTPHTAEAQLGSAKSRESQEQQGCQSNLDLGFSFPLQIKQEPAEAKELWSHQEDLQLEEVETLPSSTVKMNNKDLEEEGFLCLVKEAQLGSAKSRESQEQQGCQSNLDLGFSFPLQIKQEPAEAKELWSHQEDLQLKEVETLPSSTVKMNNENLEEEGFLCLVKVAPETDPALLVGPHEEPAEQQEWSSMVKQVVLKQEHEGAEESTKSLFPAVKTENDEAKLSLLPQSKSDKDSYEEAMEVDGDDGGGSEADPLSPSEKTANSSDGETEDSEDEWETTKQPPTKVEKVVTPEPACEESKDELKKTDQTQSETEKDIGPEPVYNSAPTTDPVSDDKTSDSSDAETETEDSNHQQRKHSAVETKALPDAAAPSEHHSRNKSRQKHKKSSEKKSAGHNFPCPHCGKQFNYRSNLSRHIRIHTKKNGSVSKRDSSLKTKHKDTTNIVCSVCGKRFTEQLHLDLHMRIHKFNTHIGIKTNSQKEDGGSGGAS